MGNASLCFFEVAKNVQAYGFNSAIISSASNIKKVTAKGNIVDSWILAGYDIGCDCAFGLQETGGGDILHGGNVGSITATGLFARSYVSAGILPNSDATDHLPDVGETSGFGTIGRIKFGSIDYYNAENYFGIFASTEAKPFKIGREIASPKGMFVIIH